MRHIGLEANCLGTIGQFQQVDHFPPAVHAAPSKFPLPAASRSPYDSAISAVSRERSAQSVSGYGRIFQPLRREVAESILTMPYGLISNCRSFAPMRQPFRTASRNRSVPHHRPSPTPRRSEATRARPGNRSRTLSDATLSASRFRSSSEESMLVCGSQRTDRRHRTCAIHLGAAVRFSIVSRSNRRLAPAPYPPGPATWPLCSRG